VEKEDFDVEEDELVERVSFVDSNSSLIHDEYSGNDEDMLEISFLCNQGNHTRGLCTPSVRLECSHRHEKLTYTCRLE
jgi:hypothetical protein